VQNHEFYAGTNLTRYLDSTWQEWGPLPDVGEEWGEDGLQGATSATSALGAFLSAGNHHGPGVHVIRTMHSWGPGLRFSDVLRNVRADRPLSRPSPRATSPSTLA